MGHCLRRALADLARPPGLSVESGPRPALIHREASSPGLAPFARSPRARRPLGLPASPRGTARPTARGSDPATDPKRACPACARLAERRPPQGGVVPVQHLGCHQMAAVAILDAAAGISA